MKPLKLVGAYGSPYSRKMRAVLRYRRIPFTWIVRGSAEDVGIPPVPVQLIPVLVYPGDKGAEQAMIDSTFQILKLESMFVERSLIPPDRALAFLQSLIEDYADEWLTKAMFHYRWSGETDIRKASYVLLLERDPNLLPQELQRSARSFRERQIGRLRVVGSNATTAPVIEESYRRTLRLLNEHLAAEERFLMGSRPGVGDFGLFGQLSQLVHFDPTPSAIAAEDAPRVVAWVTRMDDLSWLEPDDTGWRPRDYVGPALRGFLAEIGRVYAPFLLANAHALESGANEVRCEIDGRQWVQMPFPYQGKCLKWMREGYAALEGEDRNFVDRVLEGTGCEAIFPAVFP